MGGGGRCGNAFPTGGYGYAAEASYVPLVSKPLVRRPSEGVIEPLALEDDAIGHDDGPREGCRESAASVLDAAVSRICAWMRANGKENGADRAQVARFVETIVHKLKLPCSCVIAMLIYLERAIDGHSYALVDANWQPSVLAALIVAAKMLLDEPLSNGEVVNILKISNVPVSKVSYWELSFLDLIGFNTHVGLHAYAVCALKLQEQFERKGGGNFFSCVMRHACSG